MVSSTRLFSMFLLLEHFTSFSCLGAGWCPWLYAWAVLSVDDGVLQTAWCRAGSSFTVVFLGMGLVCSSVAYILVAHLFLPSLSRCWRHSCSAMCHRNRWWTGLLSMDTLFRSGCHPSWPSKFLQVILGSATLYMYYTLYMGLFPSPNRAYGFGHESCRIELWIDTSGCH